MARKGSQKKLTLSRRELLRTTALAGLGLAAAACAPKTGVEPTAAPAAADSPTAVPATAPAVVGTSKTLVIGNAEGDPPHLDAGLMPNWSGTSTVGSAAHAYLLNLTADGKLEPDLATGYTVDNPTQITYTLRENVKFHNGRIMTAEDVKLSYERLQQEESGSPFYDLLRPIEKIETPDANTVVFKLSNPYAAIGALACQIPIIPPETAADQKTNPIGAGPYKFVEWQEGNFMQFERFGDYYAGAPKIDVLKFLPRGDANAMRNGFLAGETDIVVGFTWVDKDTLAAEGATVATVYLDGCQYLAINCQKAPFDDVRVRQAMSLIIDRAAWAETFNGPGTEAAYVMMPSKSPYFPAHIKGELNYDKARALLKEAGVAEGFEIEGLIPDLPPERPFGPLWLDAAAKVGLNLKPVYLQPADYVQRVFVNKDFLIGEAGYAAGPDPALMLDRYFLTDGGANIMGYSNAEVDDLLTKAGQEYDQSARQPLYTKALEIIAEEAPLIPFVQTPVNIAMIKGVSGFALKGNYTFELRSVTKA